MDRLVRHIPPDTHLRMYTQAIAGPDSWLPVTPILGQEHGQEQASALELRETYSLSAPQKVSISPQTMPAATELMAMQPEPSNTATVQLQGQPLSSQHPKATHLISKWECCT